MSTLHKVSDPDKAKKIRERFSYFVQHKKPRKQPVLNGNKKLFLGLFGKEFLRGGEKWNTHKKESKTNNNYVFTNNKLPCQIESAKGNEEELIIFSQKALMESRPCFQYISGQKSINKSAWERSSRKSLLSILLQ